MRPIPTQAGLVSRRTFADLLSQVAIGHDELVLPGYKAMVLSCARPRAPRFSNIAGLCVTLIDQFFAIMARTQLFNSETYTYTYTLTDG